VRWLLLLLFAASSASAEPPPTETIERSYHWQGALADASAASLVGAGMASGESALVYSGVAAYALGAPLVHGLHGNAGWAGLSFGLRLTLPIATAALFAALGETHTRDGEADTQNFLSLAVSGLLFGSVTAMVVDDVVFPHVTKLVRLRIQPTVAQPTGGLVLGLKGRF